MLESIYPEAQLWIDGEWLDIKSRDNLAQLISLELSKPLAEAIVETDTAAEMFELTAEAGRRAYGRLIPERVLGCRMMVVSEPVGPVTAISG